MNEILRTMDRALSKLRYSRISMVHYHFLKMLEFMKVPIYIYLGSQQPVSRNSGISLLRQEEQLWNVRVSSLSFFVIFLLFFLTVERTKKYSKNH